MRVLDVRARREAGALVALRKLDGEECYQSLNMVK